MQRNFLFGVALIAIIGLVIFLFNHKSGIYNDVHPAVTSNQSAAIIVPFTDIAHGLKSLVTIRANYLITSTGQLDQLWKLIGATNTPPAIDFKTHAVIAAFAGKEPSSVISISNIKDTSARLVSITIIKSNGACAQKSITSPYDVAVMPVTALPLVHVDISIATTSCL